MLKGLETLGLRVERHCANALAVAQHLEREADVARVLYPGLPSHPQADLVKRQMQGGSTLVAFEVAGGKAGAFRLMNALRLIDISNNLGDAKRSEEHTSELQSLMRISYAVFCLKKKKTTTPQNNTQY